MASGGLFKWHKRFSSLQQNELKWRLWFNKGKTIVENKCGRGVGEEVEVNIYISGSIEIKVKQKEAQGEQQE